MSKSSFKSVNKEFFNCDKNTEYGLSEKLKNGNNPLTCYCKTHQKDGKLLLEAQSKIGDRLEALYKEYIKRKQMDQDTEERQDFEPIYLFLNHMSKLNDFFSNERLFPRKEAHGGYSGGYSDDNAKYLIGSFEELWGADESNKTIEELSDIEASKGLKELIEQGYQYSIYIIVAAFDDVWRGTSYFAEWFKNFIICNYVSKDSVPRVFGNSWQIENMLKSIRNVGAEESRALFVSSDSIIKLRPVIYEMTTNEIKWEELA